MQTAQADLGHYLSSMLSTPFSQRRAHIFFCILQIHTRLEHASKHRHNLAIVGGVTASILLSPLLAGLAVGKCSLDLNTV